MLFLSLNKTESTRDSAFAITRTNKGKINHSLALFFLGPKKRLQIKETLLPFTPAIGRQCLHTVAEATDKLYFNYNLHLMLIHWDHLALCRD